MSEEPKTIVDTHELAEAGWDPRQEPGEVSSMISATDKPTGKRFEFNVQMRGFTMDEMDNLVIEAAARLIVGSNRERQIAKAIEDKCIELIDQKATAALQTVTSEIIDAPMTPSFGDKKPATMRELIGLYGREYLTAYVDRDGRPTTSRGFGAPDTRMEFLVRRTLDQKFKSEIEKATNGLIGAIRAEIKSHHDAFIADEKKRLSEAIAHTLSVKL